MTARSASYHGLNARPIRQRSLVQFDFIGSPLICARGRASCFAYWLLS